MQALVVSDSPEMGFHGQSASEIALLVDFGEVSPTHAEVQEDIPSEQIASRSDKAKFTQAGSSRPLLPDQLVVEFLYSSTGPGSPHGGSIGSLAIRCPGDYQSLEVV